MIIEKRKYKAIVIGGSAGSFGVVIQILKAIPNDYNLPIILCLHRLKHVKEGYVEALAIKSNIKIIEPDDKERIRPGVVYLAPSNYHMYIEINSTIALSTEEMFNYSRPSIDFTLSSAGFCYKDQLLGIILSGANKDGARGLKKIKDYGGTTVIQKPEDCKVPIMPKAAKAITKIDYELCTHKIISLLQAIN